MKLFDIIFSGIINKKVATVFELSSVEIFEPIKGCNILSNEKTITENFNGEKNNKNEISLKRTMSQTFSYKIKHSKYGDMSLLEDIKGLNVQERNFYCKK